MDPAQFDRLARIVARLGSRRSLLRGLGAAGAAAAAGFAGHGFARLGTVDADAKGGNHKKECKKGKPCQQPSNPCRKAVCKKHKCEKEIKPNGARCSPGKVCFNGKCGAGCLASGEPCRGDKTCCSNVCVDTDTDFDHCGSCAGCDQDTADDCVGGACVCGSNPECSGGQLCQLSACVCGESGTCTVTPSSLGGWVIVDDDDHPAGGVEFVTGPETPPLGAGSVQFSTPTGKKAAIANLAFAGLAIADLETLRYSTYMQDGSTTGVVVPAIKLPVLYDNGATFTTLIFEPTYSENSDVVANEWQTWDALSADARWWSSKALPNDICAFDCFVAWDDILDAIPDAAITGGLLIETGSGTPDALGNVDALEVNDATFDFEPDA